MTCPDDCDCRAMMSAAVRVADEQTPERHLAAALDGMPELAEALAELGLGWARAGRLLKIIDWAAGQ